MKKQLIASLILSTLSGVAFALPGDEQPPLTERHQYSAPATVAEDGSERTKAFRIAEGGAERLLDSRAIAENGSERVARQSA
jgi:hypothetical protein